MTKLKSSKALNTDKSTETKTTKVKSEKVKKKKKSKKVELDIEHIKTLGGGKADVELLDELEGDDEEEIEIQDDLETEPIKRDDIRDFISQLGLDKFREEEEEKKPAKVKLHSMQTDEDEPTTAEITDNVDNISTQKQDKKSKKNKYKKLADQVRADKVQDGEVSSSTAEKVPVAVVASVNKLTFLKTPPSQRKQLLVKPGGNWYDNEFTSDPILWEPLTKEQMTKLEIYAASLYDYEVELYRKQQEKRKSSDSVWMRTVLSSGTSSDKMAALTVFIQESYVHSLHHLDSLVSLVKKKSRREAHMALSTLQELVTTDLLPDSRKLRTFQSHPHSQLDTISSGNHDARDKRLVLWMFEHRLKNLYGQFVGALQEMCHDTVSATKQKAIDSIWSLLASKPEQEKLLLGTLVNKLGDPDHKLAAHTAHLLTKLVEKHPNMKQVIVIEVERLLYRSNITPKAQYYAICFLNQIVLSNKEKDIAKRLVTIYFSFFRIFVKKRDLDSKMLAGLLSGVNRAWRFAKMDRDSLKAELDTLYRLVPTTNFNTALQSLLLLQQVSEGGDGMCERFYSTLYRAMLDPGLCSSSKQPIFLSLLLRSLRNDDSTARVAAFLRRLLQLCLTLTPSFACGALIILSDLVKKRPGLLQKNKESEDVSMLTEDGDEDEEKFVDVDDGDVVVSDGEDESQEPKIDLKLQLEASKSSWNHRVGNKTHHQQSNEYNPNHRNPMYAQADVSCTWELGRLVNHYHPSVSLFAQTLLQGGQVNYQGDPLHDFTLIRFLDRFVYRNPKTKSEQSEHRPTRKGDYIPTGVRAIPVNTPEFLQNDEDKIPVDEQFFYKYFKKKAESENKVEDAGSDDEEVSDTEFDDFLDDYEAGLTGENAGKDKWEMDFAKEMQKVKGKDKGKDSDDSEDDEDDDGGDDDADDDADGDEDGGSDLSDEEVDFDPKEFGNEFDESGDWEEDVSFSESDDADDMDEDTPKKSKKRSHDEPSGVVSGKPKKRRGDDLSSLFAAAEEFSHLIDEDTSTPDGGHVDMVSSEAVSVKDKASAKQIAWEARREKDMQGTQDWRKKKGGKPMGGKKTVSKKTGNVRGTKFANTGKAKSKKKVKR